MLARASIFSIVVRLSGYGFEVVISPQKEEAPMPSPA
jgi:hypothetical protein